MRRRLVLAALLFGLLASTSSICQTTGGVIDTQKIYITSFFNCDVYWGNRRIATLKRGTRAQILQSTEKWILVKFWSGGKYITGWIKR
jgi:hypothetical protein